MSVEAIPPPFVITDDDKRGLVVVITVTTLTFIWACLLIRIWLRLRSREWKSDDHFLVASTILGTVQSALVLDLTYDGLGTSLEGFSYVELRNIGKEDFCSQILYVLTLLLSKTAVLCLYLRLSPRSQDHVASLVTLGVSGMWALASIVLIALPCNPLDFWIGGPERCPNIHKKWEAICAIDIITEAAIFMISVYLVAMLNMKLKAKIMVVAAFSARLPIIATSALHLIYLRTTFSSPDRTLTGSYYAVCTQGHLGYSIMSLTVTGLGPILRPSQYSFSTTYRRSSFSQDPNIAKSSQGSVTRPRIIASQGEGYQLSSLKSQKFSSTSLGRRGRSGQEEHNVKAPTQDPSQDEILPADELSLRPDVDSHKRKIAVSGGDGPSDEEDAVSRWSDESRHMIITKTTELKVEMDRRSSGL